MASSKLLFVLTVLAALATSHAAPVLLRGAGRPSQRQLKQSFATPRVAGTNVDWTQEYSRYGDAGSELLQNQVQLEAANGNAHTRIFQYQDSRRAAEQSTDTRGTLNSNNAQATVMAAASNGNAYRAAREAAGMATMTLYGHGMNMDASNRASLASTDAQRAIQAHMDDPFAATSYGAETAWAASFPMSHQWTNKRRRAARRMALH